MSHTTRRIIIATSLVPRNRPRRKNPLSWQINGWRQPNNANSASALGRKRTFADVRYRPEADVPFSTGDDDAYRITSSARRRSDDGIVRPSALAVPRLITSSNLVGCSTARSPGLAPFRILSAKIAARRYKSAVLAP